MVLLRECLGLALGLRFLWWAFPPRPAEGAPTVDYPRMDTLRVVEWSGDIWLS